MVLEMATGPNWGYTVLVDLLCSEKNRARKKTALGNCARKQTLYTALVHCASQTALVNILWSDKNRARKYTGLVHCACQYTAFGKLLRL